MFTTLDEVERTMLHADPVADLRQVLSDFSLPSLRRLQRALEQGHMVTHCYVNTRGWGCVMYWLAGVTSKAELLAYPFSTDAIWWAARRVVRWFDNGRLSDAVVTAELEQELAQRMCVPRHAPVAELLEVG